MGDINTKTTDAGQRCILEDNVCTYIGDNEVVCDEFEPVSEELPDCEELAQTTFTNVEVSDVAVPLGIGAAVVGAALAANRFWSDGNAAVDMSAERDVSIAKPLYGLQEGAETSVEPARTSRTPRLRSVPSFGRSSFYFISLLESDPDEEARSRFVNLMLTDPVTGSMESELSFRARSPSGQLYLVDGGKNPYSIMEHYILEGWDVEILGEGETVSSKDSMEIKDLGGTGMLATVDDWLDLLDERKFPETEGRVEEADDAKAREKLAALANSSGKILDGASSSPMEDALLGLREGAVRVELERVSAEASRPPSALERAGMEAEEAKVKAGEKDRERL